LEKIRPRSRLAAGAISLKSTKRTSDRVIFLSVHQNARMPLVPLAAHHPDEIHERIFASTFSSSLYSLSARIAAKSAL